VFGTHEEVELSVFSNLWVEIACSALPISIW
jgi:hypothetical protein